MNPVQTAPGAMSGACFVTGTDTGIGKTHAACALLHAARQAGLRACGMKPVASGCERTPKGLRNEDAQALMAASSEPMPYEWVNPTALAEPVSPHIAAAWAGVTLDPARWRGAFKQLRARHDWVVVEGAGGWMVPLDEHRSLNELPRAWRLPVVLVVGLRLGCINHALLTARAILADSCTLAGWIANEIDPTMQAPQENLATLRACLPAPCLGVLPHGVPSAQAASALAPSWPELHATHG